MSELDLGLIKATHCIVSDLSNSNGIRQSYAILLATDSVPLLVAEVERLRDYVKSLESICVRELKSAQRNHVHREDYDRRENRER